MAGGQLPREQETADAFQTLQNLYQRWITDGAFGDFTRVTAAADITAEPMTRVIASGVTVTLPESAADWSIITVIDPQENQTSHFIYDAAAAQWQLLNDLDLTSLAPFSQRDPLGLTCALAVELADEYGQQLSEITVRNAARFQLSLTHNWSAPDGSEGVYY